MRPQKESITSFRKMFQLNFHLSSTCTERFNWSKNMKPMTNILNLKVPFESKRKKAFLLESGKLNIFCCCSSRTSTIQKYLW